MGLLDNSLSIVASVLTIVGATVGLLSATREKNGLRIPTGEGAGGDRLLTLTKVGVEALTFRVSAAVALILSAAAYLFARFLFDEARTDDEEAWAVAFNFCGGLLALTAVLAGVQAFRLPVRVLRRPHGFTFAAFAVTMGGILFMFVILLGVTA